MINCFLSFSNANFFFFPLWLLASLLGLQISEEAESTTVINNESIQSLTVVPEMCYTEKASQCLHRTKVILKFNTFLVISETTLTLLCVLVWKHLHK